MSQTTAFQKCSVDGCEVGLVHPEEYGQLCSEHLLAEAQRLKRLNADLLAVLGRIEDLDWRYESAESAMVKVQVEAANAIAKVEGEA